MQPTWKSDCGTVELYLGDCLEVLPTVAELDTIVTSPPYAEQRNEQYGGIPEHRYPLWTANWMIAAESSMKDSGSYLVNIREHISGGQISDYVHKTRMLLRDCGFNEAEELIWIKPNSPPVGSINRPRRAWERVLWFSKTNKPYCNPKANGNENSESIGFSSSPNTAQSGWVNGFSDSPKKGISRHKDYVTVGVGMNDAGVLHPAKYPTPLAEWLVKGWTPEGGTVCDPFTGSGTTGVACVRTRRKFIGIEIDPTYFEVAKTRIQKALAEAQCLLI